MKSAASKYLIVSLFCLLWMLPSGYSLSGRNWSVGFPFEYITYRAHFTGNDFGGSLNVSVGLLMINLISAALLTVAVSRIVQTRFQEEPRTVWCLFVLVAFTLLLVQPRTFNALDAELALRPAVTLLIIATAILVAFGCCFVLIKNRIRSHRKNNTD